MSSDADPAADRLAQRYGQTSSKSRWVVGSVAAVIIAVMVVILAMIIADHAQPKVSSGLVSYEVVDEHSVEVRLDVRLADGVQATCLVRAFAADHTPVGDLSFTPIQGGQSVTVRTERRATAVEKVGCTAPGQSDPR